MYMTVYQVYGKRELESKAEITKSTSPVVNQARNLVSNNYDTTLHAGFSKSSKYPPFFFFNILYLLGAAKLPFRFLAFGIWAKNPAGTQSLKKLWDF